MIYIIKPRKNLIFQLNLENYILYHQLVNKIKIQDLNKHLMNLQYLRWGITPFPCKMKLENLDPTLKLLDLIMGLQYILNISITEPQQFMGDLMRFRKILWQNLS